MERKMEHRANTKQMIPIMMTAFIAPFMGSALNLSVPSMSEYFSAGAVSIGWVVTSYFLSSTALLIPLGRLADLRGKKPMFVTGILIFGVFSLLCACAWNVKALILLRLGQGIGASMLFATNSAIIASNFPLSMRGQMMGLSVMCTYLGLSAGPVLGGFFNEYLGWRSIFVFAFLYCVPSFITSALMLDDDRAGNTGLPSSSVSGQRGGAGTGGRKSAEKKTVDLQGCVLFILASTSFLFGLTNFTTMSLARIVFLFSLLLILLFVWTEKKSEDPLMDLGMFTENRTFTLSNAAALLNYGASSSISYLISVYLQNVRGMSSDRAGIVLIATPILQALLSPLAGKLSDRYSPYKLASSGMFITCAGIVMLIFLEEGSPLIYLICSLAVVGTGFALFSSPNSNAIMSSVEKQRYGVASSIMSASRTIGQTASMAVVTMIIGAVIGNVTLASAPAGSVVNAIHLAFIVNAVLCGIGIFCSAKR